MSINTYNSSTNFKNGEFHHAVLSISGTVHTLFLDGIQVAQNTNAGNIFSTYSTITNTTIGCLTDTKQAFRGFIGDFKVYNKAINATAVSNLYLNRNLVVYYPFDVSVNKYTPNNALLAYDASFIGTATTTSNALIGTSALSLTNTTKIKATSYVASSPILNENSVQFNSLNLSISCWVNTLGLSNTDVMCLFDIPSATGKKGISVDICGNNSIYSTSTAFYMTTVLNITANSLFLGATGVRNGIGSILIDTNNNIYYSDFNRDYIWKITPAGINSIVAGNGTKGTITVNGLATSSNINSPSSMVFDTYRNLFFVDRGNFVIAKINTSGIISIFAGIQGQSGYPTSGLATLCNLGSDCGRLTIDTNNNIYFSDITNSLILKITPDGIVSIVTITSGTIFKPNDLGIDGLGNIYYTMPWYSGQPNKVFKINTRGEVSVIAGNGTTATPVEGLATNSSIRDCFNFLVTSDGIIYLSSNRASTCAIIMIKNGYLSYIAGNSTSTELGTVVPNSNLLIYRPYSICLDQYNNIIIYHVSNYNDQTSPAYFSRLTPTNVITNTIYTDALNTSYYRHVALTISGSTHTLYLDSSIVATNTNVKTSSLSNFVIGSAADLSYGYTGYIDDFKIWNRALPASDIYSIYSSIFSSSLFDLMTQYVLNVNTFGSLNNLTTTASYTSTIGLIGTYNFNVSTSSNINKYYTYNYGSGDYPIGIIIDNSNNIYYANSSYNNVIKIDKFGNRSIFASGFTYVMNLAFDSIGFPNGYLYVLDNTMNINKLDVNGNQTLFKTISVSHFLGFAFNNNNIYFTSSNNNVYKVDSNAQTIFISGTGIIVYPLGIAFDSNGNAYVICNSSRYISKFDSNGNVINAQFISIPSGDSCKNIKIYQDSIYTITALGLLQKYDINGTFISNIVESKAYTGFAFDKNGNLYYNSIYLNKITNFMNVFTNNSISGNYNSTVNNGWIPTNIYNPTSTAISTTYNTNQTVGGDWLQIQLPSQIIVRNYNFSGITDISGVGCPTSWILLGSNNGSNWASIDDQISRNYIYPTTNNIINQVQNPILSNATAYYYYRLVIVKCNRNYPFISNFNIAT
jgi:hypothetical protein